MRTTGGRQQHYAGVGDDVGDVELSPGSRRPHLKRRAGIYPDGVRDVHDVGGGGQDMARGRVDHKRRRDRAAHRGQRVLNRQGAGAIDIANNAAGCSQNHRHRGRIQRQTSVERDRAVGDRIQGQHPAAGKGRTGVVDIGGTLKCERCPRSDVNIACIGQRACVEGRVGIDIDGAAGVVGEIAAGDVAVAARTGIHLNHAARIVNDQPTRL